MCIHMYMYIYIYIYICIYMLSLQFWLHTRFCLPHDKVLKR